MEKVLIIVLVAILIELKENSMMKNKNVFAIKNIMKLWIKWDAQNVTLFLLFMLYLDK